MGLRQLSAGLLIALLVLAGCEGEATPIAAVLPPTPTPTQPPATLPPPIRYALADNVAGYVTDMATLQATGLVEQLADAGTDEQLIAGYDVVMRFGVAAGWQQVPRPPQVALLINSNLPPLDDPLIATVLRNALDGDGIIATLGIDGATPLLSQAVNTVRLRNELANLGHPDGFLLTLAHTSLPGIQQVQQQLAASNFETRLIALQPDALASTLTTNRAHLLLTSWAQESIREAWTAQIGDANVLMLYDLPISYRAVPDVQVQFAANGWPIASR